VKLVDHFVVHDGTAAGTFTLSMMLTAIAANGDEKPDCAETEPIDGDQGPG
jgi:hypothetical protein